MIAFGMHFWYNIDGEFSPNKRHKSDSVKRRITMAIKSELLEKFKMTQTVEAANLKAHIGEVLVIERWELSDYVDSDGAPHTVLALKVKDEKEYLRTEVKAFIDKFNKYVAVFGDEPLEDRPALKITGKTSRKKNDYISFDLVDFEGNAL